MNDNDFTSGAILPAGVFSDDPVALAMRQLGGGSLFLIGLATPCSTVVQIALRFIVYARMNRRDASMIERKNGR